MLGLDRDFPVRRSWAGRGGAEQDAEKKAESVAITPPWGQNQVFCLPCKIKRDMIDVVVVVQSPSRVRLFVTPWTAACQVSLSLTISWSLPKFVSIASVMPSRHLILWRPLLLLPSVFPSIRDFFSELSASIRWPKYRSFSFNISPSSEYSRLISLKIDWFDLLTVQGTFGSPPAPQFKGISSLVFCLLYGPALTTVCDHWEDHSLYYTDFCQQSNVSDIQHTKDPINVHCKC